MTNEEKALELAEANIRVYENSQYDYAFYAVRDACVEMAQWKDEQLIKKACEWISNELMRNQSYDEFANVDMLKFVEDFEQAMKGE